MRKKARLDTQSETKVKEKSRSKDLLLFELIMQKYNLLKSKKEDLRSNSTILFTIHYYPLLKIPYTPI